MPSETVTAQRQDNGTFRAELPQSDGIFAVDALWDGSSATYTFCTQAEGSEELHPGAVLSIGESEDIRKIDISWRSGSVNIYAAEQSAQISVKEESTAPLAESEKMVCAIDGDTLRILPRRRLPRQLRRGKAPRRGTSEGTGQRRSL